MHIPSVFAAGRSLMGALRCPPGHPTGSARASGRRDAAPARGDEAEQQDRRARTPER